MNRLLILPHQDDELFCYSMLDNSSKVIIVFKGGGEPKGYVLSPEDLYNRRNRETLKTCEVMGVRSTEFLAVNRPHKKKDLYSKVERCLQGNYDYVVTTMMEDAHPEHKVLSEAVLRYANSDVYGFIVHSATLTEYTSKNKPDIKNRLTEKEYEHKILLADNYVTQKHFLPNVIRRTIYNTERYWRLN